MSQTNGDSQSCTPGSGALGRISVIVPVRNAMPYLVEALASIEQQTLRPCEVIVVDGGSTDGSRQAAAAAPGVTLVQQSGRGLAHARNEGLAQAHGDLIAFLDADDFWAAQWLETAASFLHAQPTCPAVIGRMVRFLHDGVDLPPGYAGDWLGSPAQGFTPGSMMARRIVFAQVGHFNDSLTVGCDSEWFMRAADAGVTIMALPEVGLHKRIHAANLSAQVETYRRELLAATRRSLQRRGVIRPETEPTSC